MEAGGGPVVILAALGVELKPLAARARAKRTAPIAGLPASAFVRNGIEVRLAVTGMGRLAIAASRAVLHALSPSLVISAGTAGGLHPSLETGAGVLADSLSLDPAGSGADIAVRGRALEACRRIAAGKGAVLGKSLTVGSAVAGPEDKKRLFESSAALICEMESFHVAQACAGAGADFAAARVVSDTARDSLPAFAAFSTQGRIDPLRMAEYFAARPDEARRFASLARKTAAAARRLPDLVLALIDLLRNKS